ncbi:hypothetical protein Sste5346_002129 [Sporothrix stenoceras]|uniref:Uncharacterized protein n=1 Tax=Sporothrix stenoceras TaxID=5173 RepID=A0ABR3ZLH6_9PEZI
MTHLAEEFLNTLYKAYGEANSDGWITPPLSLHSLTFGMRYYPGADANLEALVDLHSLRAIHINNKLSRPGNTDIRFKLFGPDTCSNLRFYGIGDMTHQAFDFLTKTNPEWTRRLALVPICAHRNADRNLVELMRGSVAESRPPQRVRMMAIELPGYSSSRTESILADLVALDDGTLEGLRVLMGTGKNLEFDHLDKVLEALGKLKGLRQLILHQRWRSSTRNLLLGVIAQKAAMAIPTLQFIHIPDKSWQVHRTRVDDGERYDVQFEPLDKYEEAGIELFRVPVVDG